LGAGEVGVDDNFFELGGHSLLAAQVVSRVWDVFNLEISLQACFDKPTIAELSAHIEAGLVAEIAKLSDEEARAESDEQ
jgi:acyl carrier protein